MRVFLDANILVAVLNKEYPVFTYAARIVSLAGSSKYKIFTSPLCLAIAFYFAEKKSGRKTAKEKLKILASHIEIAGTDAAAVQQTITNKKIYDFEDGLEYYSAIAAKCDVIVTEDIKDFYFSDIEVLTATRFFEAYMKSGASK
jgi:predicted nucleic acid-binding protein